MSALTQFRDTVGAVKEWLPKLEAVKAKLAALDDTKLPTVDGANEVAVAAGIIGEATVVLRAGTTKEFQDLVKLALLKMLKLVKAEKKEAGDEAHIALLEEVQKAFAEGSLLFPCCEQINTGVEEIGLALREATSRSHVSALLAACEACSKATCFDSVYTLVAKVDEILVKCAGNSDGGKSSHIMVVDFVKHVLSEVLNNKANPKVMAMINTIQSALNWLHGRCSQADIAILDVAAFFCKVSSTLVDVERMCNLHGATSSVVLEQVLILEGAMAKLRVTDGSIDSVKGETLTGFAGKLRDEVATVKEQATTWLHDKVEALKVDKIKLASEAHEKLAAMAKGGPAGSSWHSEVADPNDFKELMAAAKQKLLKVKPDDLLSAIDTVQQDRRI